MLPKWSRPRNYTRMVQKQLNPADDAESNSCVVKVVKTFTVNLRKRTKELQPDEFDMK